MSRGAECFDSQHSLLRAQDTWPHLRIEGLIGRRDREGADGRRRRWFRGRFRPARLDREPARARGENEFLVADRSLGLFPLVATLVMTEFNTSTLLAFSAAGYRAGPMALALPFVFLVGLTFYTFTVARAWKRFIVCRSRTSSP